MQAPVSLPEQRQTLESIYTFLKGAEVFLEAVQPALTAEDRLCAENLRDLAGVCGDRVEQRSPRVFPFSRPEPRKTSGLREALSAGHLNGVRNAFQQVPRTWNRGRRTPVCALVV
jgi:hypothetical protein